ncbi:MAG: hypothetical protein WKF83_15150 [Nocardioidaceae bacterium]
MDDELGLPATQPYVHRSRVQLGGDLGGRVRQRFHQRHAHGGVEREGEPLGRLGGLRATRCGGVSEIVAQAVDVRCQVHDTTMTSL